MKYNTYVLFSASVQRFYIGQTQDIEGRMTKHNKGYVKSTRFGRPWSLMYARHINSRSDAMALERQLKNLKSQKRLSFASS